MGHFAPGPRSTPAERRLRERQRLQARALIQERARQPRFSGVLEPADGCGIAHNPHCGDSVAVSLRFSADRRLEAVRCACRGCVLSVASADLMAELLEGRSPEAVEALACGLAALLRGEAPAAELEGPLAPLRCLTGLPARARCVLLPWQALRQALAEAGSGSGGVGVGVGGVSPGDPG